MGLFTFGDVLIILFIVPGIAVWCGFFRRWAYSPNSINLRLLMMPWISLGLAIYELDQMAQRILGVSLPPPVIHVLTLVMFIPATCAAFERPAWVVPPWFRDLRRRDPRGRRPGGLWTPLKKEHHVAPPRQTAAQPRRRRPHRHRHT